MRHPAAPAVAHAHVATPDRAPLFVRSHPAMGEAADVNYPRRWGSYRQPRHLDGVRRNSCRRPGSSHITASVTRRMWRFPSRVRVVIRAVTLSRKSRLTPTPTSPAETGCRAASAPRRFAPAVRVGLHSNRSLRSQRETRPWAYLERLRTDCRRRSRSGPQLYCTNLTPSCAQTPAVNSRRLRPAPDIERDTGRHKWPAPAPRRAAAPHPTFLSCWPVDYRAAGLHATPAPQAPGVPLLRSVRSAPSTAHRSPHSPAGKNNSQQGKGHRQ